MLHKFKTHSALWATAENQFFLKIPGIYHREKFSELLNNFVWFCAIVIGLALWPLAYNQISALQHIAHYKILCFGP
jgi:hypothetical protein